MNSDQSTSNPPKKQQKHRRSIRLREHQIATYRNLCSVSASGWRHTAKIYFPPPFRFPFHYPRPVFSPQQRGPESAKAIRRGYICDGQHVHPARGDFHFPEKNIATRSSRGPFRPVSLIPLLYCERSELNNAMDVLHRRASQTEPSVCVRNGVQVYVAAVKPRLRVRRLLAEFTHHGLGDLFRR